ncbi:methylmalonyl Co-A mutase-associated GTPase MeaB, partial [candidate division KSB1 bacterium]
MPDNVSDIKVLIEDILKGDRLSLARGISIIENDGNGKEELISGIYSSIGKAHRIGITGPPGVGKSTLTLQLAKYYRSKEMSIGIIAVDPTSPFTGGALLGDRIRMNELFNDPKVFIRSMATRGSLGGLAAAATESGDLLDASGKDMVIFETVGTGQSEMDIAETCDSVILVLAPETGDGIQALKAGFMEIADLIVINKSEREGSEKTEIEMKTALSLRDHSDWEIPVIKTVALQNLGVEELAEGISDHLDYLKDNESLEKRRQEQLIRRVKTIIRKLLRDAFWTEEKLLHLNSIKETFPNGIHSPYITAREMVNN